MIKALKNKNIIAKNLNENEETIIKTNFTKGELLPSDNKTPCIPINNRYAVPTNIILRDERVSPLEDFSNADKKVINIFAHRGPNEPKE